MTLIVTTEMLERPLFGFKGAQGSGKSACAEALREVAGSDGQPKADVEFSDAMLEAANLALKRGGRRFGRYDLELFRDSLVESSSEVLGIDISALNGRSYHSCGQHSSIDCPECSLEKWLRCVDPGLRLTRDNKACHRAVLSELGVIIRKLAGEGVWANEVTKRIQRAYPSNAVTVGGVRYPDDAKVVWDENGLILEIFGRNQAGDPDPTNARSHEIIPDVTIWNNVDDRTLAYTKGIMAQFWADFTRGQLKAVYGTPNP